jgi:TPP-dependent pyruvate/acetoin dehydrogenase alpha subunit
VERARAGGGPTLIEALTYRPGPHSTADDPTKYRSAAELQEWEAKEPLPRFRRYLEAKGVVDAPVHAKLEAEVDAEVRDAIERAEARMREARVEEMFDHVYGDPPAELERQRRAESPPA